MTRAEHLAWAKGRALEYVKQGNNQEAFSSLFSDLGKHDETKDAQDLCGSLGMSLLAGGFLGTPKEMTDWVEGFN